MKWERVELGDLVEITSGGAFKSKLFNEEGKGLPLVRIRNVGTNSTDTYYKGDYDSKYIIDNQDFLISMDGEFRVEKWLGGKALLNQRVCKIDSASEKLDRNYLYRFLPFELKKIEDKTSFVTVKHLSVKKIKNIQIPLPPLPEQCRLAARLDKADAVRQKSRALVEAYAELGRSVFLEVFGDPVRNPHNFPKGIIEDLVSEVKYGTSKKAGKEGKFKYLRMNNITYSGDLDLEKLKYIDLTEKEQPKYLVKKGDILFNRTNSKELVGKTTVFNQDEQMAIAGYIIRVRTNELANPYYISGYLNSRHGKMVLENMCKNIVGMANINAKELQSIPILLPPLPLQTRFAAMVANIESQRRLAERQLEAAEAVFGGVLQGTFEMPRPPKPEGEGG
jgi:type I restriction enzyme S subunit